jgi:hypothetical protein
MFREAEHRGRPLQGHPTPSVLYRSVFSYLGVALNKGKVARTCGSPKASTKVRPREEDMAELVDATDLKIKESCTLLSALKAI